MITSFKGGVGKSTVSANLALRFAMNGKRTLLADCDFRMRSLDVILGCEDEVIYDLNDVLSEKSEFDDALIKIDRAPLLYLCPAPFNYRGGINAERFKKTFEPVIKSGKFDYVIFDTPGASGEEAEAVAGVSDSAYIVATHGYTSIRAAEATAVSLAELGVKELRLLINMFETNRRMNGLSLKETIDSTHLQLIGVIPSDFELLKGQNDGIMIDSLSGRNVAKAFENVALRTEGENVPLFTRFRHINRAELING